MLAVNKASGAHALALEDLLSDKITPIAIANPEHAPYTVQISIASLSREVEEAGRLDGCTEWGLFWYIYLARVAGGRRAGFPAPAAENRGESLKSSLS